MSYTKFIDDFFNSRASQIQLGLPGKITKVDNQSMRADVQPLFKLKNSIGESVNFPILSDIPILYIKSGDFYVRPEYQIDDYVWIGFSTHDIENALNEEQRTASDSLFSKENAVIISGFATNKFSNSKFSKSGLLIGSDDSLINITSTEIIINDGTDYAVKYNALKTAFDQLKSDFDAFVAVFNAHSGHGTGSPPSTPAGNTTADMSGSKVAEVRL